MTEEFLHSTALPAGATFFPDLVHCLLEGNRDLADTGDFSSLQVLVPALPMAVELRSAWLRVSTQPILLPRFDTLKNWVASQPLPGIPLPLPESERLVLLHEALRQRHWFDESALWGIASELAALFDELTTAAIQLPDNEAALAAQLEQAYALRASSPLAFEARVVHELWHALVSAAPDAAAVYRRRLAELAKSAETSGPRRPLFVLLDAAPDESLTLAERDFLLRYGRCQRLFVCHPAPREARLSPLSATLDAAWPTDSDQPLIERAQALVNTWPESPLVKRLQLVPTSGREQEAQAAVAQIAAWLLTGLRRIAIIAQDRLSARRVRALLEREGILAADETGWLLSTSRAAATVDAVIETAAGNGYYRDLLDLCKSPFVFSDLAEDERQNAVFGMEKTIREASIKAGLAKIRHCLLNADISAESRALELIDRVNAATTLLRAKPAPLARWINRLYKALDVLGALPSFAEDIAGQALLDLLEARQGELTANTALFSFNAWRDWLNREFEAASFRDSRISSPIVITALNAVCLRRFEAALLLGSDARQLAPASHGEFFNQSVRRELGLRTREDGERELRRDLELLLATVPRVTVTWQAMQNGEANLLAPEFALLASLHHLAWGDDLHRQPLPALPIVEPEPLTAPGKTMPACPAAPAALIPTRVSVSAYASLVACPYRFFARHVLRLGEMDEVREEMVKRDYGDLVHRVLERFHARHPVLSGMPENQALSALQACVDEVFGPAVADNFLATGWRQRWEKRLAAYLDWQRQREAEGWRWAQAETRVSRTLPLANGKTVELYGRIDRIDRHVNPDTDAALYDYKTQTAKSIRDRLDDDLQLPAYALMHGDAAQAAYVALDDEKITSVTSGDDEALAVQAHAQGERLITTFSALHAETPLPAHGVDSVCRYCEMRGLCRQEYV